MPKACLPRMWVRSDEYGRTVDRQPDQVLDGVKPGDMVTVAGRQYRVVASAGGLMVQLQPATLGRVVWYYRIETNGKG